MGLLDFGDFVICRAAGIVDNDVSIEDLRSHIREELGARPMIEVPSLRRLADSTFSAMPQIDPQNVLVIDKYQIEISSQTMTAAQHGQKGIGDLTVLLVTTNPLSPQYIDYASAKPE